MRFIELIEENLGMKATLELMDLQPGDVPDTRADVVALKEDVGYQPATTVDEGIPRFIEWYREYYGV